MLDTAIYFVSRAIAIRSGLKDARYRIADGRFVLDNKDLSRVRFTTDEYINGLSGVEKTTEQIAQTEIARNGFVMGDIPSPVNSDAEPYVEEEPTSEANSDETENENTEEG